MLSLDPHSSMPLVTQIVQQISQMARNGTWSAGTRLPSIRKLAQQCNVSPLTVSNAYNRLVADGLLEAKRASGFFVTSPPESPAEPHAALPDITPSIDSSWMLKHAYESSASTIQAGCGWLPDSYLFLDGIQHAFKALSRRPDPATSSYGNPYGHTGLRELIRLNLLRQGIHTPPAGIILTHGASQALELSIRCLTQPGDTVLVEDPGYCNLFPTLQALRLHTVGIPRLQNGPCLDTLEQAIKTHAPKAFVINSRLHNPTGTSCSASVTHHVLSLAERFNITLIEDDTFGGLAADNSPTLAQLDQLKRVIFIGSFSKTISPGLRVGFLACSNDLADRILHLKMASSLTSSSINEAVVFNILADGRYRLHLNKLREKLSDARKTSITQLEKSGLNVFSHAQDGFFLWARFRAEINPIHVTQIAAEHDIMLAPGFLFSPEQLETPWFRFNASHMSNPRLYNFLASMT